MTSILKIFLLFGFSLLQFASPALAQTALQSTSQNPAKAGGKLGKALYKAAARGRNNEVIALLAQGANPNGLGKRATPPLLIAAYSGHLKAVSILLEAGADPDGAVMPHRVSALNGASQQGHADIVIRLLKAGADVNLARNDNVTPLYSAAAAGHDDVVKLLIAAGADIETKDKKGGGTPLYVAALDGHASTIGLLLDGGADIHSHSKSGLTPLHAAAAEGRVEAAQILLKRGAKIDARTSKEKPSPGARKQSLLQSPTSNPKGFSKADGKEQGVTPMDFAVQGGHKAVAKVLWAQVPKDFPSYRSLRLSHRGVITSQRLRLGIIPIRLRGGIYIIHRSGAEMFAVRMRRKLLQQIADRLQVHSQVAVAAVALEADLEAPDACVPLAVPVSAITAEGAAGNGSDSGIEIIYEGNGTKQSPYGRLIATCSCGAHQSGLLSGIKSLFSSEKGPCFSREKPYAIAYRSGNNETRIAFLSRDVLDEVIALIPRYDLSKILLE